MSIKRDLKKEGIEVISKIDTLTVNGIARNVSKMIVKNFPEINLNEKELFINISRLNMYYAKLPKGISAKYFYKNKTIYFDNNIKSENITDIATHECIHYLQERYDTKGKLIRLGLCDFTNKNLPGTGLNEAAVQLAAAKCAENSYEQVRYFDINLQTNTEAFYPLECALVNQMAYLVGENTLFESTFNANDKFKEQYISLTSEDAFNTIQRNIDKIMETQDYIENLYINLQEYDTNEKFLRKCTIEIEKSKEKIKELFLSTQKLIYTSYFDNAINLVYTPKLIENYRNKLYLFKNIIGHEDGDNSFNEYYIDKMMELEKRYEIDESEIKDLVIIKESFIAVLLRKIKMLFGLNTNAVELFNK